MYVCVCICIPFLGHVYVYAYTHTHNAYNVCGGGAENNFIRAGFNPDNQHNFYKIVYIVMVILLYYI